MINNAGAPSAGRSSTTGLNCRSGFGRARRTGGLTSVQTIIPGQIRTDDAMLGRVDGGIRCISYGTIAWVAGTPLSRIRYSSDIASADAH